MTKTKSKQDAALEKLVHDRLTPDAIAEILGCTRQEVTDNARRLGLTFAVKTGSNWSAAEDNHLIKMAKAGLSSQQIAELMPGRTEDGVYNRARALRAKGEKIRIPPMERNKTQNRTIIDKALMGRVSLQGLSLPLNRIAEALE